MSELTLEILDKAINLKELREKLLTEYKTQIEKLDDETWSRIKSRNFYYCREFSMNKIVSKFKLISPFQESGAEKETMLTFQEVRRILLYILLGNDYMKKWKSTKDYGLGEPISIQIVQSFQDICKEKEYDYHKVHFGVENNSAKGDYTLVVSKKIENFEPKKHKTYDSAEKSSKTSSKPRTGSKPLGDYISAETIVPMIKAIEAVSNKIGITISSNGQLSMLAVKLCETAADLIKKTA